MAVKETTSFHDFEKAKKGEATKKRKGPVTHFEVKPAGGGKYVSTARHENMGSGPMYEPAMETKKSHPTIEHAAKHMAAMFGEKPAIPSTPENEEENAAAGAPEPAQASA